MLFGLATNQNVKTELSPPLLPPPTTTTKAQLDEYIRRLEETERSLRTAEAKIAERDERIMEVERLLDCMGKVKGAHVGRRTKDK